MRVLASSEGLDPASLRPGEDLVLEIPREHGAALPHGVLLDDLLPLGDRVALDREAIQRLAGWSSEVEAALTFGGVSLAQVWEVELLAEVFLPEVRVVRGLQVAMEGRDVGSIDLQGLDEGRRTCLQAVLGPLEIRLDGDPDPPPRYPGVLAAPWKHSLPNRLANLALDTVGAPTRVRGAVYVSPYWHLTPLLNRLLADEDLLPVLDPARRPGIPPSQLVAAARRGGWVGHPNLLERRRARRSVRAAVAQLRGRSSEDELGTLLADRALTLIEHRAAETPAFAHKFGKAFGSGSLRLAVLPYDSPPETRVVVAAARGAGIPALVVQHGFGQPEPNDPDKTQADALAVWSDWDRQNLTRRACGEIVVTGNPGAAGLRAAPSVPADRGRTLVLVEYISRLSLRADNRTAFRHVHAALEALASARPGTTAILRPHPADHAPATFALAARDHTELDVAVDGSSPIETLVAECDLCVAAVSTAALQAGLAGLPVVLLNVTGAPSPWPFDEGGPIPVAMSADELAQAIPSLLSSNVVAGQARMAEALGVRDDAVERVLDAIRSLASD